MDSKAPVAGAAVSMANLLQAGDSNYNLKRKRQALPGRAVVATYGAPTKIKSTKQPVLQQSNVTYNAEASPSLCRYRKRSAARTSITGQGLPEYPDGGESVYNLAKGELAFRSSRRTDADSRISVKSNGYSNSTLYSSFNLLPVDEEPVFAGIVDTPVIFDKQMQQSATNGFSLCVQGTRSLVVGPETVNLFDDLFWDYPPFKTLPNSDVKRPQTEVIGIPSDKFVAVLKPMTFDTFGSMNIYRNLAAYFMGTFAPRDDLNPIFSAHRQLQQLLEWVALADTVDFEVKAATSGGAAADSTVNVFTELARITKRDASVLRKEWDNLKAKATTDKNGIAMAFGQAAVTAAAPARMNKGGLVRLINLQIAENNNQHTHFFLKRRIGLALGSGRNESIAVFVRAGRCV